MQFADVLNKFAVLASLIIALGASLNAYADDKAVEPSDRSTIGTIDVGIKGYFKVGFWMPVRIEISGIERLKNPRVEVIVPDSDGVPTTVTAKIAAAESGKNSQSTVAYTKVGRVGSSIQISLLDGESRIDERTIRPNVATNQGSSVVALSPTAELIVSLGQTPLGIEHPFSELKSDTGQLQRQFVEVSGLADLPIDWFGYSSVDVLLISAGDGTLLRELAADSKRLEALTRWVQLGGRLAMFCGGQSAESLFVERGPLARFAPGKLAEVVRLPETGPLEHFAGASAQKSAATGLRVARFTDVLGNIEVYGGRRPSDLPIVVRSPNGLGEVVFAGVDLSQPPLAAWPGRSGFLQAVLRPYLANTGSSGTSQRLVTRGYNDLAGALRQRLGQSFASVVPIGFAVVAGLAIAYMIFLGPLDYLLVNRWTRRPWVAWVSFPLIVLVFCAGAKSLSNWRKGQGGLRVNRMELIDVDMLTNRARGIYWASLYSPDAARLDLSVRTVEHGEAAASGTEVLFSWWGLPGVGIGGMQSGGTDLGIINSGYRYGPDRNSLEGVPLLASSTKALMARWSAPIPPIVEADLTDQDGLAVGSIVNRNGPALHNVRLLYGTWAYRLGNLDVGQRIDVGEQLSPRKVKTIVTHDVLGESGAASASADPRVFVAEQASAKEILSLMMFYDAAGGFGFAHLPNRFQWYCDLSRLLELGRAIVVADAAGPVTQLIDNTTGKAIGDNEDESTVIYRFVLPVGRRGTP